MIRLVNVNKKIKNEHILRNVNISFNEGHIYTLIGPNGAGKTTIISILSRLMEPDTGEVIYDQGSSNVFLLLSGERNLYYKISVKENIYYFGTIRGLTRKQINKNVEKYNGLFEIEHLLHKKVETLSYGQKRIVATFIGMVCGSKCIVLDEVTEGLDVETKLILSRMLREIKKEKIVILVSHDLEFIETCNDYNIFIKNGKIIEVNERTQDLRTIYDQYILATEGD